MTTATYTCSERCYNEIALQWFTGISPNSSAVTDLRSIAQTCLADGGRAVLSARGLCEAWLKEHYSEDGCQQNWQGYPAKPEAGTAPASGLSVVPNPTTDAVRIRLMGTKGSAERKVEVLSMDGQRVYSANLSVETLDLELSVRGWPAGVYAVRILDGKETISRTFVVQTR